MGEQPFSGTSSGEQPISGIGMTKDELSLAFVNSEEVPPPWLGAGWQPSEDRHERVAEIRERALSRARMDRAG